MASLVATPHALRDSPAESVRGILIVAAAYVVMTLGDVAAKWALLPAGIAVMLLARGIMGSSVIAALVLVEHDWRRLMPVRPGMVLLRCLVHVTSSLTWYIAWLYIPLADSYALGFTAPLLMTLLAIPLLGERIRWRRAMSTAIGFGGMLLMVRPGGAFWRPELLILAPGVLGLALSRTMTRMLSTTETAECLTFWLMAAHLPVALLAWSMGLGAGAGPFTADVWVALLLIGVLNGSAHWMMARGYALAPVSVLAPYEYTTLIYGTLLGWLAFRELPAPSSIAGAVVVAAAGLYNLHRERMRRAQCAS